MGEGGNTVGDTVEMASLERVEALLEAARYDDIDDIISLESAGLSLDSKDLHGRTGKVTCSQRLIALLAICEFCDKCREVEEMQERY
ncbi:hypothetical protein C1H46_012514 [Malus baccata]|uniref:Uncharacterized protein n=1 Tax=Malus baccata TaxID=106549 RepID=A0A540MU43_MALBA|nr:hypothetical protein C1H46_012514 [Malus baccata]